MDRRQAEAPGDCDTALITPDNGKTSAIALLNATLTNDEGILHDHPEPSIAIDQADLEQIMAGNNNVWKADRRR